MMVAMNWLVAFALLVAVCAWVLTVYHRLHTLQLRTREAWQQWERATSHRNACVEALAPALAPYSGSAPSLPQDLRHAAQNSERGLGLAEEGEPALPAAALLHPLGRQERSLRELVANAFDVMDELPQAVGDATLMQLGSELSVSLFRQEQHTEQYNRAAENYNEALQTPSGRLVASALHLVPAERLAL